MAKVHIMMATYNGEIYLQAQIDSIIKQTYTDWKLFISDDCSSDKTYIVLKDYEKRFPDKIEIISHDKKLGGAKQNFSYLFQQVPDAEYYMFVDQDDVWAENKIEKMIFFFEKNIAKNIPGLVYCDLYITDNKLKIISDSFMKHQKLLREEQNQYTVLSKNFIPGCVMIFNHTLKKFVKDIPTDCYMHDWWITLVAMFFGQICFLDESLNYYRQHESNTIGAYLNQNVFREISVIFKGLFSSPIFRARRIMTSITESLLQINKQCNIFLTTYNSCLSSENMRCFEMFKVMINSKNRIKALTIFWKYFKYPNLFKNLCCSYILLFLSHKVQV